MAQGGKNRSAARRFVGDGTYSLVAISCLGLLAGFISLPIVSLLIWTVDTSAWRAMLSPVALQALSLSIRTTSVTLVITILIGTPAAYALSRFEFPGKKLVDTLVDIPAVLPPSAAGIALLLAFGRLGLVGEPLNLAFGITITFTTVAVILAELFVAMHFYVRYTTVGFDNVDRSIEEAAMVDGAGRGNTFLRITVPLAFPSIVAGAVMAWARALGEFGATIIFAGNVRGVTQTMPLAIYAEFQSDLDAAVALSLMVLVFAFAVILTVRLLTRRSVAYRD
ncbi:ABC transporter permease [Rubrobacter indicoceani]|uniref:ABC transporter permease n=1 Tax=Rubrobacter indicoceani TaxID=2051957 RepID=UPI001F0952A4|nr:ABC transporter permease [Rubrobacter indicoceani]